MPDDSTEGVTEHSFLGCNHQSTCMPSYSLYVYLLCYPPNVYPEGTKVRVSSVQWSKPYSILAPTQDSNPGGRIQHHERWPLHYHCNDLFFYCHCSWNNYNADQIKFKFSIKKLLWLTKTTSSHRHCLLEYTVRAIGRLSPLPRDVMPIQEFGKRHRMQQESAWHDMLPTLMNDTAWGMHTIVFSFVTRVLCIVRDGEVVVVDQEWHKGDASSWNDVQRPSRSTLDVWRSMSNIGHLSNISISYNLCMRLI